MARATPESAEAAAASLDSAIRNLQTLSTEIAGQPGDRTEVADRLAEARKSALFAAGHLAEAEGMNRALDFKLAA